MSEDLKGYILRPRMFDEFGNPVEAIVEEKLETTVTTIAKKEQPKEIEADENEFLGASTARTGMYDEDEMDR
ncbi:MAG: hypothetical protein E7361_02150 [Clostridiales bacterium]|nr:hypothetical protein [Clostridiales bacterium]